MYGPQFIAAFPVPSACNNLFTRSTAGGAVLHSWQKTRIREFGIPSVIKDYLQGIVQTPEIRNVFCARNENRPAINALIFRPVYHIFEVLMKKGCKGLSDWYMMHLARVWKVPKIKIIWKIWKKCLTNVKFSCIIYLVAEVNDIQQRNAIVA